jgi:isopentenyldiphosphate isomerase
MELIDLIDEQDRIIGVTDKDTSHQRAQLHRCVIAFVFHSNGAMYIQKRTDNGLLDHAIGGHVRQGESYEVAMAREAEEELRITDRLTFVTTFMSDETFREPVRHLFGFYTYTTPPHWQFTPTDEVHEIMCMDIKAIVEQMNQHPEYFSAGFINAMKEYLLITKPPPSMRK